MASIAGNGERQLNFDFVHQHSIPGVWNKIKLSTFPENFVVLGFVPSDSRQERLFVQGIGGPKGLGDALRMFQSNEVQFCCFRVTVMISNATRADGDDVTHAGTSPRFVLMRWIGINCTPKQRQALENDLASVRDYFHGVDVIVPVTDLPENEDGDEKPEITEKRRRMRLEKMTEEALYASEPELRDSAIDFTNRFDVHDCTHYDDDQDAAAAAAEFDMGCANTTPASDLPSAVAAASAAKGSDGDQMESLLSDSEIADGLSDPGVMAVLQGLTTGNFDATSMAQAMKNPYVERILTKVYNALQEKEEKPVSQSDREVRIETRSCDFLKNDEREGGAKEGEEESAAAKDHLELVLSRLQLTHAIDSLKAEASRKEAQKASQDRLQERLANRKARKGGASGYRTRDPEQIPAAPEKGGAASASRTAGPPHAHDDEEVGPSLNTPRRC